MMQPEMEPVVLIALLGGCLGLAILFFWGLDSLIRMACDLYGSYQNQRDEEERKRAEERREHIRRRVQEVGAMQFVDEEEK